MKNSILTIIAFTAIVACKNNNTKEANSTVDSTAMRSPSVSEMKTQDSADATIPTDATSPASLSSQDKMFADEAAQGGIMEVMMGKLAAANAENAYVKALGEMMVKDHSNANDELKRWASQAGYTLPTTMNADQQKMYDDLKAKKGKDFDRAYTDLMVSDHKKDIESFKKEASTGTDASLKAFASSKVPTLEHHLMKSQEAKAAVK